VPYTYPIFLDLSLRRILIVGGGAVAARKAKGLLAAGAVAIRAVAPRFVRDFPAGVRKIDAAYSPGHLQDADLVFAATDSSQVNDAVVADARAAGALVQRVESDDDDAGDFIIPAVLRCGGICVAVSAGSPALAAAVRDRLAGAISDEWVNLADALRRLRPMIKSCGLPAERRRQVLRAMASQDAATALSSGGTAALWAWARQKFAELPPLQPESGLVP
jgi:precorrin-2 dehydrogenase/sirohydrochlorin ferrochelatase